MTSKIINVEVLVDKKDKDLLIKGTRMKGKYVVIRGKEEKLLHREVARRIGDIEKMHVIFKDGNRMNCTRSNLSIEENSFCF